jgi:hypothetical protein
LLAITISLRKNWVGVCWTGFLVVISYRDHRQSELLLNLFKLTLTSRVLSIKIAISSWLCFWILRTIMSLQNPTLTIAGGPLL